MIPRTLTKTVIDKLQTSEKAVIILGARQVGKTTLATSVINDLGVRFLTINGDQRTYTDVLSSLDLTKISGLVEGYDLLFVDEAQRIPEIGLALKIIVDNLPHIKVLVTGSSSLDLASKVSEPLTGRTWTYHLYPISFLELSESMNRVELDTTREERLIYGSYPEAFSIRSDIQRKEYLINLVDGYLYKDLLEFGDIKNSRKIRDLLKLLAFQCASQVSLAELASALGMSKDTVARYIDLLEKSYVVFRLKGFSRNLRKEVSKMDKVYFYDLGVRNAIIGNFNGLSDRTDAVVLWENFLIVERLKYLAYTQTYASPFFWRTYTGTELDYIEERDGNLYGYEFKLNKMTRSAPKSWGEAYQGAQYQCVNRDNYLDFIAAKNTP